MDEEIDYFVALIPESGSGLSEELRHFVQKMEDAGQSLTDWDIVLVDSIHKIDQITTDMKKETLATMYKQFEYLSLYR